MTIETVLASSKDALVTVGGGRGFLVETRRSRLVITVAHCLPHLPPAHPASSPEERTYPNLVGPLGEPPIRWAECLFVDPIADVAVLGAPDNQVWYDESEAYERLVENRRTVRLGRLRQACTAWLLTLDGDWEQCSIEASGGAHRYLSITVPTKTTHAMKAAYAPGTSGSPIVGADGRALGMVSGGPSLNPVLTNNLPAWLLAEIPV